MLWPKVVSHVVFSQENQARAVVRSYFALGQSCLLLRILPQVRLGPWFRILRPARMGFLQLLIWQWSCRPRALLEGRLPTSLLGFQVLSSGYAWLPCSQLRPVHWPEAVQLTRRPSWFGGRHKFLEFVAVKLCSIIGYDNMGDSILADDILVDELLDLYWRDGCKHFCLNLFSEVVDSHYCILYTTSPFGKLTD